MGSSVFLSSADGDVRELLELPQGCKDAFGAQEGRWDFSRYAEAEKSLTCVEVRISWFLLCCSGIPLEL